ncbi:MAG: response regulator receiver domain protein [Tardiphaga sp.]|nr:response regulator receiver domain protein [Tardiphaga sp.]MDB5574766.1 response regulator receiver domain protein [Tardiphaga sp.]
MSADISTHPLILIVEDDDVTRMDAAVMIREAGYDVLEATNADQAIALLESDLPIAVMFTDIEMPGSIGGQRLAHAVRDRWPPVHIVATSGHFDLQSFGVLPDGVRFLPKPYLHAAVTRTLSEVLSRAA